MLLSGDLTYKLKWFSHAKTSTLKMQFRSSFTGTLIYVYALYEESKDANPRWPKSCWLPESHSPTCKFLILPQCSSPFTLA